MWNGTSGGGIGAIATRVSRDPELAQALQMDPERALNDLSEQVADDLWARRVVVVALSVVALVATAGGLGLSLMNRAVPQLLMALGSMALGALITLLATGALQRPPKS